MAETTSIEWTDSTWNPIRAKRKDDGRTGWHCTHVSEGCRNCYAETINKRLGTGLEYKPGHQSRIEIYLDENALLKPLRWKKPRMIFVGSMTDLFADFVTDAMLNRIFAVMALSPQHVFQLLTKRPERMRAYIETRTAEIKTDLMSSKIGDLLVSYHLSIGSPYPGNARFELVSNAEHIADQPEEYRKAFHKTQGWPLPNVWLGTSVEDQPTADARIPVLLATPAAVRFVSYEPALGPVDFRNIPMRYWGNDIVVSTPAIINALNGEISQGGIGVWKGRAVLRTSPFAKIDWIIAGGESGPKARPTHPDWFRQTRDQCAAAGVAFLFKQWGEWIGADEWLALITPPKGVSHVIVNGQEWKPTRPLNFTDAKILADVSNRKGIIHNSDGTSMIKVGKQAAGRHLDGTLHNGFPPAARGGVPAFARLQSEAAEATPK